MKKYKNNEQYTAYLYRDRIRNLLTPHLLVHL